MLSFLFDENFNNNILRGLIRKNPTIDIVRVQDTEFSGADDPTVLEWAARENRILLTHDVTTITKYAYDRIASGKAMPGVFAAATNCQLSSIIEDILLLAETSTDGEWEGQILYLPLS
ncbi:MAG: DUF5615 family PIN-like protein [Desulfococcaceae bacterium]|jgi:hypothetical protein|nr:DUF5615 family PIN-like protein [Desulfococcaceae bacterium]